MGTAGNIKSPVTVIVVSLRDSLNIDDSIPRRQRLPVPFLSFIDIDSIALAAQNRPQHI